MKIKLKKQKVCNINEVAKQLAKYLNIAQEFTEDYHETLNLGKDGGQLLVMDGEKLKRIGAMLYVCYVELHFHHYEINYDGNEFTVKVLHFDCPF